MDKIIEYMDLQEAYKEHVSFALTATRIRFSHGYRPTKHTPAILEELNREETSKLLALKERASKASQAGIVGDIIEKIARLT